MIKNILVTGASGFIGSALCSALRARGLNVIGLTSKDGDIVDPGTLKKVDGKEIDHVFHLAGRTFVPDSWKDPTSFYRTNIDGTINVLEFCRANNLSITFVSAYLYGLPIRLPIKESDPINPNNPYALSKHLAENVCSFYASNFGIPVTIVRPFNIFGKGQKTQFLIPEILEKIRSNKTIAIKDLAPRRDYLYLDDLLDGLLRTMIKMTGCRYYNFGSGYSISVKEVIDIAQDLYGSSLPVISENVTRINEIPDVVADISRARDELGWKPTHTFTDGLKEMIEELRRSND